MSLLISAQPHCNPNRGLKKYHNRSNNRNHGFLKTHNRSITRLKTDDQSAIPIFKNPVSQQRKKNILI